MDDPALAEPARAAALFNRTPSLGGTARAEAFWRWKPKSGQGARKIDRGLRDLISGMSKETRSGARPGSMASS